MNIFEELGEIYSEVDNNYAIKELNARAKEYSRKEREYKRKRELNNHAYFLFMFSKLEDRIKELSNILIENKHTNISNWKYRRTWDILHKRKDKDRIYFMERVALLTESGHSDYNIIERYYIQRNNIAHGSTFTISISIPTVISDMKRFYRDIKE